MGTASGFSLTPDLLVQGLVAVIVFAWAIKDAIPTYQAMKKAAHPNPAVAGMSIAWDRDMQERMLQIFERMATAAEIQARSTTGIAGSQQALVDQQRHDMNERIDELLKALARKEDQLSAMIVGRRTGR